MIKAVIFDMDGVLVDSEGYHFKSFQYVLREYNLTITEEEYLDLVGIPTKEIFEELKQKHGLKEDIDVLFRKKEDRDLELIKNIELNNGALELIELLKANGYKIALASVGDKGFIEYILTKTGIKEKFDVITTLADITKPKPDPEVYLMTAKKLGVAPKDCFVLEDSETGVNSAKNAGMRCVAISHKWTANHDISRADLVVKSLKDINLDLIKNKEVKMDKGENYEVKDIKLAEQGRLNIEWAESQMGALLKIKQRFEKEKPLQGVRVGLALHVTKETAVLVKTLIAGGAEVAITGCNPLSTQDDVAAALAEAGVKVWAYKGETDEDYYRYIKYVIDFKPHITIDDGCDLVTEIHTKHSELIPEIYGGCEETTTGIIRLKAMEKDSALKYPMIAVNDNKTKHLLDNFFGTGQSTIDGILRGTSILFAGKNVVVAGYGDCGKGVSLRAKGMGANVIVTEIDHFRALQAKLDGYRVMPMKEAAKIGDIFITVTGNKGVIKTEHMELMKNNAILANSGHFDVEIDYNGLKKIAKKVREIRPYSEEFTLDSGKKIIALANCRLVNLSLAEGHPSEVMSTSFCGQALACEYLVEKKGKLPIKVITLPEELDNGIAKLQLEVLRVTIDIPDKSQLQYMDSWLEGT